MDKPTVCAIMLTADRPEYARRAVECFRRQTYPDKRLLILDAGMECEPGLEAEDDGVYWVPFSAAARWSMIGELRNAANAFWTEFPILIHWDDDDYSHPNRIAEQVALLQSSGADAVGYNEMLFWREDRQLSQADVYGRENVIGYCDPDGPCDVLEGESWLYTGSILGTSLCYWRKTWERVPFRSQRLNPRHDPGVGEDHDFLLDLHAAGLKSVGVTAMERRYHGGRPVGTMPSMIGRIHAGNTSKAYDPAQMAAHPRHWKRVPEWDGYARSVME